MVTRKSLYRLLSAALAILMVWSLLPVLGPERTRETAEAAAATGERTIFLNIGRGGFNEANTSALGDKLMKLNGNAVLGTGENAGSIMLAQAGSNLSGTTFLSRRIYSENGFSAMFELDMGKNSSQLRADGWSFVVSKDVSVKGGAGNGLGYGGIPNSFALGYDLWNNVAEPNNNQSGNAGNGAANAPLLDFGLNGKWQSSSFASTLVNERNSKRFAPSDYTGTSAYAKTDDKKGIEFTIADVNKLPGFDPRWSGTGSLGGGRNYPVYGWVDYNSVEDYVNIYLNIEPKKPALPVLSKGTSGTGDGDATGIPQSIGDSYYIGFSGSTGGGWQDMPLKQFYVSTQYAPDITFNDEGTGIVIPEAAGDAPPDEKEIIEDYTPPSAPVIAQTAEGMTPTLLRFTVGGSTDINGVRKYQYRIGAETVWHNCVNDNGDFVLDGSRVVSAAIAAGGSVTVYARAVDNGGNISDEAAATLKYEAGPSATLTAPANGATGVFPENAKELVVSFSGVMNAAAPGTVTVKDNGGNDVLFANGAVTANDARWDPGFGKLTLPFAPNAIGYGKTYTVAVGGFQSAPLNMPQEPAIASFGFSTIAREATPNAGIDFANERLTGLANNVAYKINGTNYTAAGGAIPIQAAWFGSAIQIVKPGAASSVESAAQTLAVPARPAAPAGLGSDTGPSRITGTAGAMEYATDASATSWTSCAEASTAVAEGVYFVRYKATAGAFKSAAAQVDVAATTYTLNVENMSFATISQGDAQPAERPLAIRSSGNTAATIASVASSNADFIVAGETSAVAAGGTNTSYTVRPAANLGVGAHTARITVTYSGGGTKTATAQVDIAVRETTPNIQIDYANEQLTGFTPGAVYTVNGAVKTASTGKLSIENAQFGAEISIVKTNANTALNSLAQTFAIPARPAAPAAATAVDEEYAKEGGKLTGLSPNAMEYQRTGEASWTLAANTEITGLVPGNYQVRTMAVADSAFHGAAKALTVAAGKKHKITVSSVGQIGGANGKKTSQGLLLTFDRDVSGFAGAGNVAVSGAAKRTGAITDYGDSDAKTWYVPIGVTGANGEAVTISVESWTDAGTGNGYKVIQQYTTSVPVYAPVPEAKPAAKINYTGETLTGLAQSDIYTIDGAERRVGGAHGSGSIPIEPLWMDGKEHSIVKRGKTESVDSEPQSLTIPTRPAKPTGIVAIPPATSAAKGQITGVTAAMEYRAASGTSWTDCTGATIDNLEPGVYYVRHRAKDTDAPASPAFHSESAMVHVAAFGAVYFKDALEGYATAEILPIKVELNPGDAITNVILTGSAVTTAKGWFELETSGASRTIKPKTGLSPGIYATQIEITTAAGVSTGVSLQDVRFTVHPRAEISGVTALTNGSGLTDRIEIRFRRPIELVPEDIAVAGAAVKSGTGFIDNGSGPRAIYTLAVAPSMNAKTGDLITVSVNLQSVNLQSAYAYQSAVEGSEIHAETTVSVPRAIVSAKAVQALPGYDTGYIQFTLARPPGVTVPAGLTLPADAATGYGIAGALLKDDPSGDYAGPIEIGGDAQVSIDSVYVVTHDETYTYRVLFTVTRGGSATIAIPAYGVAPFPAEGSVVQTGKSFTKPAYFLDEKGYNFLTDMDSFQVLPDSDASGDMAARPYALSLSEAYGASVVTAVYLDGIPIATDKYTAEGVGSHPYIFDGVAQSDITNQLQITLKEGWTETNGPHRIVVLCGGDVVAQGIVLVKNLTESHRLTVVNGTGGGAYPTGAHVSITAPERNGAGADFLGWSAAWTDANGTGPLPELPPAANGTILMPKSDITLTALYGNAPYTPTPGGDDGGGGGISAAAPVEKEDDEQAQPDDLPFTDVSENDWFFDDVAYVYRSGLMFGVDGTFFGPHMPITRGMIVTILGRHARIRADAYARNVFTDVDPAQYYTPYIAWAAAEGVVFGVGDGRFEPNAQITRQDLATMLYRYARFIGKGPTGSFATRIPFADVAKISDYATEAILWTSASGIVKGRDDGTFDPHGTATRAEAAAMLHRFASNAETQ
jgi:hypothetical protein